MSLYGNVMRGVREHSEGRPVTLDLAEGRTAIRALNESGYNSTYVDLLDLVDWLETPEGGAAVSEAKVLQSGGK